MRYSTSLRNKHIEYRLVVLFVIIMMPCITSAQPSLHPYLGVVGSVAGVTGWGFGAEGGVLVGPIYVGFELGSYKQPQDASDTSSSLEGEFLENGRQDVAEVYDAVDVGYVVYKQFLVGVTGVFSRTHFDAGESSWFNIGPDIRYRAWSHALFSAAFTVRRGLKLGAAFVF